MSTSQSRIPAGPAVKREPSFYELWLEKEKMPSMGGLIIPDLRADLPMTIWDRKGVEGIFLGLRGGEQSMDAYVLDIPPTKNTEPEKYMFEEEYVVLSGRGATTIWLEGGAEANLRVASRQRLLAADERLATTLQRKLGRATGPVARDHPMPRSCSTCSAAIRVHLQLRPCVHRPLQRRRGLLQWQG